MDSNYETMQDIGKGKKIKHYQNDLKRIFGPLEKCSHAHKLQMGTFWDLMCTDSSYENMLDTGKAKKIKNLYNDLKRICWPLKLCS